MKWTPIQKEWPKKRGRYLATYREWSNGDYLPKYDNTYVKILRYDEAIFRFPKCINPEAEADTNREVLAWMELPLPYGTENELELSSHSEKDIVDGCIGLMDSVYGRMYGGGPYK